MGGWPARQLSRRIGTSCGRSGANHERLADLPQPETIALFAERVLRSFERLGDRLPAQLKGAVVNRHEHTRSRGIRHRHRLLRCAVIANPGIVGADRHDGGIEGAEAAMGLEYGCLCRVSANEQPAPLALDDEAGVAAVDVASEAGAPVLHLDGTDQGVSATGEDLRGFVPAKLVN